MRLMMYRRLSCPRLVSGFLWAIALAGVAVIVVAAKSPTAYGSHNDQRLIVGLATTDALVSTWWHSGSNLDLVLTSGTTQGTSTYWQSYRIGGTASMTVTVIQGSTSCKNTRVSVYHSGNNLGDYWFFHLDNRPGVGTNWSTGSGFTIAWVGSVAGSEFGGCPWTGPHLHQGGDNSAWTALFTNWNLQNYASNHSTCNQWGTNPCRINPTGDTTNRWMHRYNW